MVEEDVMERKIIGFLAPDLSTSKQLDKYNLDGIEGRKHLTIERSSIEFHPPYTLENDVDDGDRAPDDFSHWVVEIPVPEQEMTEPPSRSTAPEPSVIVPVNRTKNSVVVERSPTEHIVGEAAPRGNRSM
jgi:hypothetical protein